MMHKGIKDYEIEKKTKCKCPAKHQWGIQYYHDSPNCYDGISEWRCGECDRRWGRWTGKELFGEEEEPRYGKE